MYNKVKLGASNEGLGVSRHVGRQAVLVPGVQEDVARDVSASGVEQVFADFHHRDRFFMCPGKKEL